MKILLTSFSFCLVLLTANAQEPLRIDHFEILNNTKWKGKLTYKDYQSGKLTTIETALQIKLDGDKIVSNIQYVYEPHKNNKSSVKLKKNGTYFGNERVISNKLENGVRTFVSTYEGKDGGQKATMYITHSFNHEFYKVVKEVQLKDTKERFVRNTYEYTKL